MLVETSTLEGEGGREAIICDEDNGKAGCGTCGGTQSQSVSALTPPRASLSQRMGGQH